MPEPRTLLIAVAVARLMIEDGWHVVIAREAVEVDQALVAELGPRSRSHHLDPVDCNSWHTLLADIAEDGGHLRAVVIGADDVCFGGVEAIEPVDFRRFTMGALMATYFGIHVTAPRLRDNGGGTIVTIVSAAGVTPTANAAAHTAAQWGVRGLIKAAALDLDGSGIRVCAVCPATFVGDTEPAVSAPVLSLEGASHAEHGVAEVIRRTIADPTVASGSEFVVDSGLRTIGARCVELPVVEHPVSNARVAETTR